MTSVRLILPMLLLPAAVLGGQINGTLTENGRPVAGQGLQIRCGATVIQAVTTNATGAFSFYIPQTGICAFEFAGLSHRVYSDHDPVRYDFALIPQPGGGHLLRRR